MVDRHKYSEVDGKYVCTTCGRVVVFEDQDKPPREIVPGNVNVEHYFSAPHLEMEVDVQDQLEDIFSDFFDGLEDDDENS